LPDHGGQIRDEEQRALHVVVVDVPHGQGDDIDATFYFNVDGRNGFRSNIRSEAHLMTGALGRLGDQACAQGHDRNRETVVVGAYHKDVHFRILFLRNLALNRITKLHN
jgi:hypothetical protein